MRPRASCHVMSDWEKKSFQTIGSAAAVAKAAFEAWMEAD